MDNWDRQGKFFNRPKSEQPDELVQIDVRQEAK
jgi:hypothetical protein